MITYDIEIQLLNVQTVHEVFIVTGHCFDQYLDKMVVETLAEAHKTVRLNNVACLIARQAVAPTGAETGVPPVSAESHFPFFFPPVQETSYQTLLIHLSNTVFIIFDITSSNDSTLLLFFPVTLF